MTVAQATRLLHYAHTLGYDAELHRADRRWFRGFRDPSVALRLRQPGRRWEWAFGWRDWLEIVRTDRALAAAGHDA